MNETTTQTKKQRSKNNCRNLSRLFSVVVSFVFFRVHCLSFRFQNKVILITPFCSSSSVLTFDSVDIVCMRLASISRLSSFWETNLQKYDGIKRYFSQRFMCFMHDHFRCLVLLFLFFLRDKWKSTFCVDFKVERNVTTDRKENSVTNFRNSLLAKLLKSEFSKNKSLYLFVIERYKQDFNSKS